MSTEGKINTDYVKYIAIALSTTVGVWSSVDFILEKVDAYIDKSVSEKVEIAFKEREKEYLQQIEKRVGRYIDPIEELSNQIKNKDSIKIVYERIIPYIKEQSDYKQLGLQINKKTKEKYYVDLNGIEYKVYTESNGKMYYFDGKKIIYI